MAVLKVNSTFGEIGMDQKLWDSPYFGRMNIHKSINPIYLPIYIYRLMWKAGCWSGFAPDPNQLFFSAEGTAWGGQARSAATSAGEGAQEDTDQAATRNNLGLFHTTSAIAATPKSQENDEVDGGLKMIGNTWLWVNTY